MVVKIPENYPLKLVALKSGMVFPCSHCHKLVAVNSDDCTVRKATEADTERFLKKVEDVSTKLAPLMEKLSAVLVELDELDRKVAIQVKNN